MNPKKHKIYKEGIAEKVNVHPDVVDDFVNFYYSKLRKALTNIEHSRISVLGLGIFTLRKKRLEGSIKKYKDYLGNKDKLTYGGYEAHVMIKERIDLLEKANTEFEALLKEKRDYKNEKNK